MRKKNILTKERFLLFLVAQFGEWYLYNDYAKELGVSKERVRQMLFRFLSIEWVERVSWKKGFRITPLGRSEINNKEVLELLKKL